MKTAKTVMMMVTALSVLLLHEHAERDEERKKKRGILTHDEEKVEKVGEGGKERETNEKRHGKARLEVGSLLPLRLLLKMMKMMTTSLTMRMVKMVIMMMELPFSKSFSSKLAVSVD